MDSTAVNGGPAGVATGFGAGSGQSNGAKRWPSWNALLPTSTPHEERRFWTSYLTVTFAVQVYLSVVLIIYLIWTSEGVARKPLTYMGLLSLALAVTGLFRSRWLASRTWRSGFWLSWMCGSIVTMGIASHLDGGVESPLLFLPVLPVMSAMLGLAPRAVAMCAGLAIVALVTVFVTDDYVSVTTGALMMLSSLVLAASVLAVASSLQRARLESGQLVLLGELAESNARLITAQERAHIGTLELHPGGQMQVSDEMLRITGISRDAPMSKETFLSHVHPDDLDRMRTLLVLPAEQGQPVDLASRLIRDNGEIRDVHTWTTCTVDTSGRPKLIATIQDVTDLRAVERMKEEFLSVMGHELRTPLTSIRGALGLLAGGALGPLSAKAQRMADIAMSSSDRLIRLINDILDVERMSAGKSMLQLRSCAADEVVQAAVGEMAAVATEARISLRVGGLTGQMWADRDRVLQTLINLIGNAVKFSSPGGRIAVSAAPADGMVVFTIVDHGRGVPAEQREAVFDRFRQVDASDARQKGGTGLGLAICKGIVEEHGGRIRVTDTPGGGATFSFTLPAEPLPAAPPSAAPAPDSPVLEAPTSAARPVTGSALICDDDPNFVEVMATLLHTHGYATVSAFSGEQAVELAVRDRPAVIVLDLMMPGMSGWDTLTELRRHPETADIPVLILTALGPQEILDPRVSGWVSKTAGSEELLRTLRHALGTDAPPTVLVVEDDKALAQVLAAVFEGHGANTVVTGKGRDAITLTSRIVPDLLVLDVGLPDMDGFAVVDALRRNAHLRSVPLVVYSGVDLSEADRTRLRLGETRFLAKGRTSSAEFEHQVLGLLDRIAPGAGGAALPRPDAGDPEPPA